MVEDEAVLPGRVGERHPLPGPDPLHAQLGSHLFVSLVFVGVRGDDRTGQLLVLAVQQVEQFPVHPLGPGERQPGRLSVGSPEVEVGWSDGQLLRTGEINSLSLVRPKNVVLGQSVVL